MSKVKVVLISEGIQQLLKSQEMKSILNEHAKRAVSRLGVGYEASAREYKERSGVVIAAVSKEAQKENSKNNTILKAIGG